MIHRGIVIPALCFALIVPTGFVAGSTTPAGTKATVETLDAEITLLAPGKVTWPDLAKPFYGPKEIIARVEYDEDQDPRQRLRRAIAQLLQTAGE
jgi:hypothetical protein